MGLFGFGKKKWDEEKSDKNKKQMRLLFNNVVEDGDDWKLIYGFGVGITNSNYILARKTTYEYTSLIIGYRQDQKKIALVQTTPELEGCSEPEFYQSDAIKKAKTSGGEFTIWKQGGMMAGYIQFMAVDDNDESFLVYLHQPEEEKDFTAFFKEFAKR